MTDQQKIIIDEELEKIGADFNKYDEYINHCYERGMFNEKLPLYKRVPFTKANIRKLYRELYNPIKKATMTLKITNKELAERIGYTEGGLANAIIKDKINPSLLKTLELLLENHALKEEITKLKAQITNKN